MVLEQAQLKIQKPCLLFEEMQLLLVIVEIMAPGHLRPICTIRSLLTTVETCLKILQHFCVACDCLKDVVGLIYMTRFVL